MAAPKKKRQHYVPRFLLRNFSSDKIRMRVFRLNDGISFDGGSIAGQCQEDYYYGQDGILEDFFASEEAEIAKLLFDTSPEALEKLSKDDLIRRGYPSNRT